MALQEYMRVVKKALRPITIQYFVELLLACPDQRLLVAVSNNLFVTTANIFVFIA